VLDRVKPVLQGVSKGFQPRVQVNDTCEESVAIQHQRELQQNRNSLKNSAERTCAIPRDRYGAVRRHEDSSKIQPDKLWPRAIPSRSCQKHKNRSIDRRSQIVTQMVAGREEKKRKKEKAEEE
jgi:hypothetical protein